MKKAILLLFAGLTCLAQPRINPNYLNANIRSGTTVPTWCEYQQLFVKTDAIAGNNLYVCINNAFVLQAAAGGGPPTGGAGAGLSGTYPNPTIAGLSGAGYVPFQSVTAGVLSTIAGFSYNSGTGALSVTSITGNAATATALAATPAPCAQGSFVTSMTADGTPTCAPPPSSEAPGYLGNSRISGGSVLWTGTGYVYTVAAATYSIGGITYSSPETNVTLGVADKTNPRFDVFAVDSAGTVVVIPGTPAVDPVKPDMDPATQLELTFELVGANTTQPANTSLTDIYHENPGTPTEWSCTASGAGFNLASTNNPHLGTKDIEATAVTAGDYVECVAAAAFDPSTRNDFVFHIRSKAAWPNTRSLQFTLYNGVTRRGSIVAFRNGTLGFLSATTGVYQQVAGSMELFGAAGLLIDRVRITVAGSGATIGFYLDDFVLQGGIIQSATNALAGGRAWDATLAYKINDVVVYGGTIWRAIIANSNQVPGAVGSNWSQMVAGVSTNTASTVVARDASGNFTAGTITAALTGNSSTASALAADPADCINQFARGVAASGAAACASVAGTDFAVQNANKVLAGPTTGADALPGYRALVSGDIPNNAADTSGKATTAGAADTAASLTGNLGGDTTSMGMTTVTVALNGTNLAGLATGVLGNTNKTGVPVIVASNAALTIGSVDFTLDGGGSAITTGAKGWVRVPYAGTLTGWELTANVSGSIVIDLWKDTFANFPPDVTDTIWGTKPALAGAQTNSATGLSIAVTAGDYIRLNVDSAVTVTYVVLSLKITKS
jgi:hypothetical protein